MRKTALTLLYCGSFNPITYTHLSLFETARYELAKLKPELPVVGAILSPVHDDYRRHKASLISATHRTAMVAAAVDGSDCIFSDFWETEQAGWSRTISVLDHHRSAFSNPIKGSVHERLLHRAEAATTGNAGDVEMKIKLLCGADVLQSFAVPGLWEDKDLERIVTEFGLVVVARADSHPDRFVESRELLKQNRNNINIVEPWIQNDVSSTKIRDAVRLGRSVRYLVPDAVWRYIEENSLYRD